MGTWEKKQPIEGGYGGCMNCGYQYDVAPMDMRIAVGFGDALVTKDGKILYDENNIEDENAFWTTQNAEDLARKDPDHDWRIVLNAPLSGRTYQRHGDDQWMLIEKNMGFM